MTTKCLGKIKITLKVRHKESSIKIPEISQVTRVVDVHVKSLRPQYENLAEWMKNPNNVYIGRKGVLILNGRRFPEKDSIWANPYTVKQYSREDALRLYEEYIREKLENDMELVQKLIKLKGKTLGCWCHESACHGDVLVTLIRKYDPSNMDSSDKIK
jgi:hypothetical protein